MASFQHLNIDRETLTRNRKVVLPPKPPTLHGVLRLRMTAMRAVLPDMHPQGARLGSLIVEGWSWEIAFFKVLMHHILNRCLDALGEVTCVVAYTEPCGVPALTEHVHSAQIPDRDSLVALQAFASSDLGGDRRLRDCRVQPLGRLVSKEKREAVAKIMPFRVARRVKSDLDHLSFKFRVNFEMGEGFAGGGVLRSDKPEAFDISIPVAHMPSLKLRYRL